MSKSVVARLPFKTTPHLAQVDVGNDRCGVLVFPEYHDLTVNETAFMAAQATETNTFSLTSRLALKIAKLERVPPLQAHGFVAKVLAKAMGSSLELTAKEEGWTVKYVKELELTAIKVVEISIAQQNLLVTAVIRHRLEGCQEWLISDTARLPGELVEEIYKFATAEKNHGVVVTLEDANREVEEALGKLKTVVIENQSQSTGQTPSTELDTSTPEVLTSLGNDLDSSQPPT